MYYYMIRQKMKIHWLINDFIFGNYDFSSLSDNGALIYHFQYFAWSCHLNSSIIYFIAGCDRCHA